MREPLKCYICLTDLNPHTENTYTRNDDQRRCHSDCLIRLAENQGNRKGADAIQNLDQQARKLREVRND